MVMEDIQVKTLRTHVPGPIRSKNRRYGCDRQLIVGEARQKIPFKQPLQSISDRGCTKKIKIGYVKEPVDVRNVLS
jgi:hypothetical protein